MSDELQQLRDDVHARKVRQNERRAAKGAKPMWPELLKAPTKKSAARSGKGLPIPESGLVEDSQMTFGEWTAAGWSVKKGSKAVAFDLIGNPLFDMTQVRRLNPAWQQFRDRQK